MTKPSSVTDANVQKTKTELATRFGVDEGDVYVTLAERGRTVDGSHEAYYFEAEFEVRIPMAGLLREREAAAKAAAAAAPAEAKEA